MRSAEMREGMVTIPKSALVEVLNAAVRNEHRSMPEQFAIREALLGLHLAAETEQEQTAIGVLVEQAAPLGWKPAAAS